MNITFVTSASKEDECLELLDKLGVPFERKIREKDGNYRYSSRPTNKNQKC